MDFIYLKPSRMVRSKHTLYRVFVMGGHASFLKPKQTEWIKRWVLLLLKGCKADCRIFRLIRSTSSSMYFEHHQASLLYFKVVLLNQIFMDPGVHDQHDQRILL